MKGLLTSMAGFVLMLGAEGGLVCETLRLGIGIVLMGIGAVMMAAGMMIAGREQRHGRHG